jgi:hypothetical protein
VTGCCTGIGADFLGGLDDRFNAVNIFVADDLQHRFSIGLLLELDDSHILIFRFGNHGLQHKRVDVAFIPVEHADIIDISIAVEVQVVYFRIRVIQPLLKIFRRRGLLEQLKRPLQAEIIPGNLRICVLGKSRYHSKQHDSNHR